MPAKTATPSPDHAAAREMLARLVSFPSVSAVSNLDIIHFIRDYLAGFGVESRIVPSPEGDKANLWAVIGPQVEGGIVFSGHTDVVPVEGQSWTSDPWMLTEREGRLYGRGACDMKGFNATVLAAVPQMVKAPLKRPIYIAMSYDEEVGCAGAGSMVTEMAAQLPKPEAVFVGEPTRLKVVTGHKGSIAFFVDVTGHSVHSSNVDRGVSAVMTGARLVTWFEDVLRANAAKADPACPFDPPYTTPHVGMIKGGTAANIVAKDCGFVVDIRVIPEDNPFDILERFKAYVRDEVEPRMKAVAPEAGIAIRHRSQVFGLRPEIEGTAERLARQLTGDNAAHVVSYGTEAGIFQRAGWSTVVCGPGDIAQAHQPDEYIEVSELAAGTRFVARAIERLTR